MNIALAKVVPIAWRALTGVDESRDQQNHRLNSARRSDSLPHLLGFRIAWVCLQLYLSSSAGLGRTIANALFAFVTSRHGAAYHFKSSRGMTRAYAINVKPFMSINNKDNCRQS
jgi:hypothetical protein